MEQHSAVSDLPASRRFRGLNTLALKLIALVTMTIDHVAASGLLGSYDGVYWLMRGIGRIAFPIYCFLLVVGFHRTRSRGRYLLRLLLFAIPSEPVFNLMLTGSLRSLRYQSVMLTLAIGLATLWGMDACRERLRRSLEARAELCRLLGVLAQLGVLLVGYWLGELLRTDYGGGGVLVICLFCFFYSSPRRREPLPRLLFALLFALCLLLCFGGVELPGALALVPIFLYAEEPRVIVPERADGPASVCRVEPRGSALRRKLVKYGFYAYYPVHILVICLLRLYVWGY